MKKIYFLKKKNEKIIYKYIFNVLNEIINNKNNIFFITSIDLSNDFSLLKIGISFLNENIFFIKELNKIEKKIRINLYKKYKIYKLKNIYFFNDKNFQ